MLRLIGTLTGSVLAIAALIVAVGIPRFSPPDNPPGMSSAVTEADSTPATGSTEPKTVEREPIEPGPVDVETPVVETLPRTDEPAAAPLSEAETAALIEEIFAPPPQPVAVDAAAADPPAAEERWYAFWSPFRSEIAANGFVSRLQETTGIDYRIVKVKTGVYEVAFAYSDDNDIQDKLERISAATGLDVSGG